jgi:hypothetical protein
VAFCGTTVKERYPLASVHFWKAGTLLLGSAQKLENKEGKQALIILDDLLTEFYSEKVGVFFKKAVIIECKW